MSHAQQADTLKEVQLDSITVKAFEQNKRLKDVPAAVNYIGRQTLERFSPVSLVSAVNTTPGVRMEERSPGSYRFNIRGSALRSPFGVRNVKIYYNDIPFTDPGGQSYLNQLGYYNIQSLEIIKGPGSSLYGAGTGGVLLIEGFSGNEQPGALAEYTTSSYHLQNIYGAVTTGTQKSSSRFGVQHQQSNGYRTHSQMQRDVVSWNGLFRLDDKRQLKTTFLYGDLFYETPGALTLPEYKAQPRAARPGSTGSPGAEAAYASIHQRTFVAGASYQEQLSKAWQNKTVLYGAFTELRNPAIRNYGSNAEPHVGGRTVFQYQRALGKAQLTFNTGGEWQQGFASASVYKNVNGQPDSLQTYDEINNRQSFAFAQAALDINTWTLTGSASWNQLRVQFERFSPAALGKQLRTFNNEVAPRVALLKKFSRVTLYTSLAKGFSPPTTAELLPTGSAVNINLNAEEGTNYDLGARAHLLKKLYLDANAFLFHLNNTIVQRRDASGGDYYVNAGKTKQYGLETYLSYPLFQNTLFAQSQLWASHTWHHFTYQSFKQLNSDFSGNRMPGIAPHTVAAGFDFLVHRGFSGALTYYYSDPLPLSDANNQWAAAYQLIGAKVGYERWIKHAVRLKLMAGADNLLNKRYSLGNDINGFGGRYYNAAPGRNYYTTLTVQWKKKGITN